ncbi:uncharacterized protein LY89DRAFT_680081 [Mollisia scopiformis]|uniref:Uncharacterized protein n=1 Tax=Mollisia scopiformis TaxID=149040 RepID=A0A194XSZ1_MOLSC|nr:uncharacterized protein LY89DRAFT_680081 [Mollisia scopiformis]KUJ23313.1 hypothetical protein LY89DRAFT_680081 [Mollisia scopiformis]
MSKSKTSSDRKPIAATLDEISKCFGQFFAVEATIRGMLNGSISLPVNVVLNRETVISAENFLEKVRRARSEIFNKLVQLGDAQLDSLGNVEKKAVGSVPFNKQVNIISAMRNDCERRQKEATTRADRKSFTLTQVNDFIEHMKLVAKMVKTSGPTLKETYDILNASAYEVSEMRKEEEKLSIMSGAKVGTDMEPGLQGRTPDRYTVPTSKVSDDYDSCNSSEFGEINYSELNMTTT